MLLKALGPLEIYHDQRSVTPSATKQRIVLALLLVNANRVVPTDLLIEEIWDGNPPTSAANTLQTYIYQLRKLLTSIEIDGPSAPKLLRTPAGYTLQVPEDTFDVAIFSKLADSGSRALDNGNAAEAAATLSRALGLWRGEALCGVQLGPRLRNYVTYLNESRLRTLERHNEAQLALGQAAALVGGLKDLVVSHPDHEAFQRQLMLALARSGRRTEALDCFHAIRTRLAEELGLDPSRQLQEMHAAILASSADVVDEASAFAAASLPRPAQLLPDCPHFHGYQELLTRGRTVLERLPAERGVPPVIRISGSPAAGRRTFSTHLAHLVKHHYPDGQLYHRVGVDGVGQTLESFLLAVGITAKSLPSSDSGRAALFRSWSADRRVLIVLHDVTHQEQLEHLLPAGAGCAAIFTTDTAVRRAPGTLDLRLDGLDEESGDQLLADLVGRHRMTPAARTVVARCDGMPGLITEIGLLLSRHPDWDLAYVAELLRVDGWTVWRLSAGHDRLVDRLRQSLNDLDDAETAILALLCTLDSPLTLPMIVDEVLATTLTVAAAIDRLLRSGLAIEHPAPAGATLQSEPGYALPQLVKHFCRFGQRPTTSFALPQPLLGSAIA